MTFGLNGYMCDMTPTKNGYQLTAWDDKLPQEVRATKTVKNSDMQDGIRPEDRAQVEQLFRPLFDELDKKRDKRVAQIKKDQVDRETEDQVAVRDHEQTVRRERAESETNPVAKDGTAINMNVGENPGDAVGGEDAEGSLAHSVDENDETRVAPTPAEQQAETTKENASRFDEAQ